VLFFIWTSGIRAINLQPEISIKAAMVTIALCDTLFPGMYVLMLNLLVLEKIEIYNST
jgi:hypothetical protein